MPGHEAHRGHIVLTCVPALVTGSGRLAINGPWKRIAILAVRTLGHGARTQPYGSAQQH
jgi:hypothetical protein